MPSNISKRPFIDDDAAVFLRNKVYEMEEAHDHYLEAQSVVCDTGEDNFKLKKLAEQFRQKECSARFAICNKILKLVPAPPFEDSDPDEVPQYVLSNGDCYLLYSFADFLHKRGLMKALTLSEAKQIIFDFDNDEGGTPQADTPEQKNAHNED